MGISARNSPKQSSRLRSATRAFLQDPYQGARKINACMISDKPASKRSINTALRKVSSSIFHRACKPLHRPASKNGRPSPYNLRVSDVTAPVDAHRNGNDHKRREQHGLKYRALQILGPARATGQEMVEMTPPSPVSPPTSPVGNANGDVWSDFQFSSA